MFMKMFKNQDNKGFTLVEGIIAFAILSVIGASVASFLVSGATNYTKQRHDIDLQYEAQLTINQLQDMIISTTKALNFDDKGTEKVFAISDSTGSYEIVWKESDKCLYYSRYNFSVAPSGVVNKVVDPSANEVLMTQYIKDFDVDLAEAKSRRVVKFILDFETDTKDKNYHTTHNVTLRNKVLINDVEYIKKISEDPELPPAQADRVQILQNGNVIDSTFTYNMYPTNNSIQFTARVLAVENSLRLPSQDVTWTLTGQKSAGTSVTPNGLVILGDDEKATVSEPLYLTATAVNEPYPSKTIQIILVPAKVIEFIDIWEVDSSGENRIDTPYFHTGDKFYLKPVVTVDGVIDPDYKEYEWEYDKDIVSYSKKRNVFTVIGQPGQEIKIRAVSTSYKYPDLVSPYWVKPIVDDVSIKVTADKSEIRRGEMVGFTATVENLEDYNLSWAIKIYSGSNDVTLSMGQYFETTYLASKVNVHVNTQLPTDGDYIIKAIGSIDYKGLSDSDQCKVVDNDGEFFFLTTPDDSVDVITLDVGTNFQPNGDGGFVVSDAKDQITEYLTENHPNHQQTYAAQNGNLTWLVTEKKWVPSMGDINEYVVSDVIADINIKEISNAAWQHKAILTFRTLGKGTVYLYPYVKVRDEYVWSQEKGTEHIVEWEVWGEGKYYMVLNIHENNTWRKNESTAFAYIPIESKVYHKGSDGKYTTEEFGKMEVGERYFTPVCWGYAIEYNVVETESGETVVRAKGVCKQQPADWDPETWTGHDDKLNFEWYQLTGNQWRQATYNNGQNVYKEYK